MTYAADLSSYRDEILRWTRPQCSNDQDDDTDGAIDYPDDRDCQSPEDDDERSDLRILGGPEWADWAVLASLGLGVAIWTNARRQRGRTTPDSTKPSTTA